MPQATDSSKIWTTSKMEKIPSTSHVFQKKTTVKSLKKKQVKQRKPNVSREKHHSTCFAEKEGFTLNTECK